MTAITVISAAVQRAAKPLPPFGDEIVEMFGRRVRPALFGGALVISLNWDLGAPWPRIVLPRDIDPYAYDLDFLRNRDLLVVHRPRHSADHVRAAAHAIHEVRPRVCLVRVLPR